MKAAEEVHLPKTLRQEYGGGLKEFVGSEANCFEGSDDDAQFFTTQERQSLVLHLLHTLRAGPQDLHSLPGLKMVDGQAIIPKCISSGIISQVVYQLVNLINSILLFSRPRSYGINPFTRIDTANNSYFHSSLNIYLALVYTE